MDRSSTTIMAAVSSSAALAPLSSPSGINNLSYRSSFLVPFFIAASPKQSKFRPSTVVFSSYKSRNGMVSDSKRELLESYGLDPDEFLAPPSSSSKSRRRKEAEGTGGRTRNSPEQHTPRTTHKLLQVLGGKARRKKLLSPKGMDVRPMMEVVKGSAFDILQAAGGCPASLRPGRWLDLYSGTGSVGIEAISRGCSEVHFVEMDPWVVSDVLRPNLEWTGFLDVSMIHTVRVENFLERAEQFVDKNGQFDYISVTPPYTSVDYSILMGQLSSSALLGENTFIVVEYPLRTAMLNSCGSLVKIADRRFGRTHLAIYGPTWAQKKKKSKNSVATVAAMAP